MRKNRKETIAMILDHEGGFVDDPNDPGGATNMGVTQDTLSRLRGTLTGVTLPDHVKDLTREQARAIYQHDYWDAVSADELPSGVDLAVTDMAVNQGDDRAIPALQEAAGTKADGIIGPNTLAAVREADVKHLIVDFHALRALDYAQLDADLVDNFGRGWYRRMQRTYWHALTLLEVR